MRGRDGDVEILGALAVPRIAELTPDVVAKLGVELVAAALVPEDQGRVVSGDLRGDARSSVPEGGPQDIRIGPLGHRQDVEETPGGGLGARQDRVEDRRVGTARVGHIRRRPRDAAAQHARELTEEDRLPVRQDAKPLLVEPEEPRRRQRYDRGGARIARDERLFTYLRDCPPKVDVVIGDARLSLAKAPNRYYDIFVLDAFSSDVIPVHLLTRQALELYLRKTSDNGMLLIHISNRYMDLAPVLDRLARELNLNAFIQNDFNLTEESSAEGKSASRWIVLARDWRVVERFTKEPRWRALDGRLGGDLWTDEYSDVLKVLHWR